MYSHFMHRPLAWHFCSKLSQNRIVKNEYRSLKLITNNFNSDYKFLLNEAGNWTMEVKILGTLTLEIFKTLNNLKTVSDSNGIRTHNLLVQKRTLNHLPNCPNLESLLTNWVVVALNPVAVSYTSVIAPVSSREYLDIEGTIECRFTLKRVRDMITTYSQPKTSSYSTHRKHDIFVHSRNTLNYGVKSLKALGPHTRNSLPENIKSTISIFIFKDFTKKWFGSKCKWKLHL